jgi:hypothetical protein
MQQPAESVVVPVFVPDLTSATCSCERPLPRERADRKGAASTVCDRCGLPVRLRLSSR